MLMADCSIIDTSHLGRLRAAPNHELVPDLWCRRPDVMRLLSTAGDLRQHGNGSIGLRRYDELCIAWPVPKEANR
jgi:hypothetical protein